jgi:hypothetical protein
LLTTFISSQLGIYPKNSKKLPFLCKNRSMTPLRVVLRMFIPHVNSDRVRDLVPFEYSIYGPNNVQEMRRTKLPKKGKGY